MGVWEAITMFMARNVNIVMILLGFFTLGMLFLILYLDKKANETYELKKRQEYEKQQAEIENQLFCETSGAINLGVEDFNEQERDVLENLIPEDENLEIDEAQRDNDGVILDTQEPEKIEILGKEVPYTSQSFEESIEETLNVANIEEEDENENSAKALEEGKANEDLDEELAEEKTEDAIEERNVLENYENVIKESDAMLEAMQTIINENIVEMENLEKQNLETTEEVCQKDKVNIVSKYKVLYDKVKKEWVVKREGSTRATKRCKTREEAIEFAKKCTIDSELGLTFHKKDGKFQKKAKK